MDDMTQGMKLFEDRVTVLEGSCHTIEDSFLISQTKQSEDHREFGKLRASLSAMEGNLEHLDELGNLRASFTSTKVDIFTMQGRFGELDGGRAKDFEMLQDRNGEIFMKVDAMFDDRLPIVMADKFGGLFLEHVGRPGGQVRRVRHETIETIEDLVTTKARLEDLIDQVDRGFMATV